MRFTLIKLMEMRFTQGYAWNPELKLMENIALVFQGDHLADALLNSG